MTAGKKLCQFSYNAPPASVLWQQKWRLRCRGFLFGVDLWPGRTASMQEQRRGRRQS